MEEYVLQRLHDANGSRRRSLGGQAQAWASESASALLGQQPNREMDPRAAAAVFSRDRPEGLGP